MVARRDTILIAGTGLIATLVLGLSVLVSGAAIGDSALVTGVWWAAYLVYVLVFALDNAFDSDLLPIRRPWSVRTSLAMMFASGMVVWLLAPDLGWSVVLFLITTGAAAFELSPRSLVTLIVVQTIAIAVGTAIAGWDTPDLVFQSLAYLAFQGFAALVVLSARREAESRIELAAAHAELRATTALLETSSRSAERLRIARDLHDVVGHQLTALALELEVASHRVSGDGAEHVGRARGIAKDLLADVRSTVSALREPSTELEPALRTIVSGLPGLHADLTVEELVPLDDARRTAIVRSVQEVVTNTLRHAEASRLEVSVVSGKDGVVVCARDDGVGADVIDRGNGLTGMAERLAELGGDLALDSAPGKGFTVVARVPPP